MTEMENKVPPEVIVPAEDVVAADPTQEKPRGFTNGVAIGVALMLLLFVGVAGYYAGKAAKSSMTPTPTPTPTVTETPMPTTTETTTPTVTTSTTVTATPTVATVTKTAKIEEFGGDYKLKFTLQIPADVTVTEGKVGSWNGIILKKGTKNFMAFNLPYELYEMQGYTTITEVSSSTISNLKRVRAKAVFSNSGSYSFAVAYVSPTSLATGTDCTDPIVTSKTTSPCALPAVVYGSDIGFGAYCSVDTAYLAICDSVMKTIKVAKE